MDVEIRIPEVGESVQEALLAEWFRADGDRIDEDEALFLLETDKITLEVPAETAGVLQILVPADSTVAIGDVVGRIRASGEVAVEPSAAAPKPAVAPAPPGSGPEMAPGATPDTTPSLELSAVPESGPPPTRVLGMGPAVRRLAAEHGVDPARLKGSGPGGRITKGDVLSHLEHARSARAPALVSVDEPTPPPTRSGEQPLERVTRKRLSPIRKRIAERLLQAKHSTAMLTTFNEIDMGEVMALRKRYKEAFLARYGVKLGITSFFVKAVVEALEDFPKLNAFIDGDEVVEHHYYHVGVAVGAKRGLVVPVVRNADRLSFAEIERTIAGFLSRIGENRLELSDLEGGTFSITNGGVFGSLLSTPILNYPQSGILGLHKVEPRPVVVDGEVVVRSMMYVALSYDHRMVDGREAVQFLVRVKDLVEDPERLLVEV